MATIPWSDVARWDVIVSSGPHDAAPAAVSGHTCHLLDRHDIFHDRLARFCGEPVHPVRTSRHKLPLRPGRARGLARPDGARDAVHLGRPFADQDWPDMAVVQDGAAAAALAGKPCALRLCRSRLFALTFGGELRHGAGCRGKSCRVGSAVANSRTSSSGRQRHRRRPGGAGGRGDARLLW